MFYEYFSDLFRAKIADLSKEGRLQLKRLLPVSTVVVVHGPLEVPPMFDTGRIFELHLSG